MIPAHLRLQSGQQALTPEQEDEARRFAAERIAAQLSTKPVHEGQAEDFLREAYRVAGLAPPQHMIWLDGPLELVALSVFSGIRSSLGEKMWLSLMERMSKCVGHRVWRGRKGIRHGIGNDVRMSVYDRVRERMWKSAQASLQRSVHQSLDRCLDRVVSSVWDRVGRIVQESLGRSMRDILGESEPDYGPRHAPQRVWPGIGANLLSIVLFGASRGMETQAWDHLVRLEWNALLAPFRGHDRVRGYYNADWLAYHHFLHRYQAPNALSAFAYFNELVSGYSLGEEGALMVRRPKILARDQEGRLHSERGKCIEYHDGWGFYAWHGVLVPEQVILAPETLTRQEYLGETNVEVRRVIQERMGSRFVSELDGKAIDVGSRGTLYVVILPDDPERVARYVQVQDASTEHQYFLRVPPTIQTAAEAVAWSFGLTAANYHPVEET